MRATRTTRTRDGRISGVLCRRLLNAMVKRPGQLVPLEILAPEVWPDGPPKTWRVCLPHLLLQLNAKVGADVVVRVGNQARIQGFRLVPSALPKENVTRGQRRQRTRWPWSGAEDAFLREHAGRLTLSELTTGVNAIHGRSRNPTAVEGHLYVLGLSKRIRAYSANTLAPVLGIANEKITRWIEAGLMQARRSEPDGLRPDSKRWGWWVIGTAAVEAFIRTCPWELDWRAMQPGHALTLLAQTVQRRNPYLTLAEVRRRLGLSEATVFRLLQDGHFVGAMRVTPHSPRSSPERATWRIPLSALDSLPPIRRRRAS